MEPFVNRDGQTYHVHRLRVRYADTDRMDMVYHGTYAAYFEAARWKCCAIQVGCMRN